MDSKVDVGNIMENQDRTKKTTAFVAQPYGIDAKPALLVEFDFFGIGLFR